MVIAHEAQLMALTFKQPPRQIRRRMALQIASTLKARDPSRFSAIAVQITLYRGGFGGAAFQNEKPLRLKINCSDSTA